MFIANIFVKMDRITSNRQQNDQRPILNINMVEYMSPAEMLRL